MSKPTICVDIVAPGSNRAVLPAPPAVLPSGPLPSLGPNYNAGSESLVTMQTQKGTRTA